LFAVNKNNFFMVVEGVVTEVLIRVPQIANSWR
jgi:hypothetical protein